MRTATGTVLAGKKVLIVDDDIRNIFAMTSILEPHNMQILSAETGKAAIEILQSTPDIDIVLMDIMMPEMDGYEATRQIRQQGYRLPVVAMTANALSGAKEECLQAGMDDYITTPIDIALLEKKLSQWLPPNDILDRATLEQLGKLMQRGSDELQELIRVFYEDTEARLQQLSNGIRARDADQIGKIAHTLKSSSGYLGALEINQRCMDIERIAPSNLNEAIHLAEQLPAALDRFRQAIVREKLL